MDLRSAREGVEYTIRSVATGDSELESFLFSLGCYSGEPITVIAQRKSSCIVAVKDGRYSIDKQLAGAIGI